MARYARYCTLLHVKIWWPNPFSYDVHTLFYAQVTFTNSDQWNTVFLSVQDSCNVYLIKDVSQSCITDILDLNKTYTQWPVFGISDKALTKRRELSGLDRDR